MHIVMGEGGHYPGYFNEYDRNRRMMALTHYGGEIPACACCRENRIEFLSVDHVDGGGRQHLLVLGKGQIRGNSLYRWLYKNNYPPGFQVLCYNCNLSRGFYGYCPHESAEKIAQVKANKKIAKLIDGAFKDFFS